MIRQRILLLDTNVIDIAMAVNQTLLLVSKKRGGYICVSNVHMCMEVYDTPEFERIVNSANMILPDGRPLLWAQKLLGHHGATQVRGQDIMSELCVTSRKKGLRIGLYGGQSESVLAAVESKLKQDYPSIKLSFQFSPPFRPITPAEDAKVVNEINSAGIDILFVGIGCPKQERWMAEHKDKLRCVMFGVGAAFDFIAGQKKYAPRWMQQAGLEWFFRLCIEPKRLWKRYLINNPRFIFYFGLQLIKVKLRLL
jgi:N-acetylglucosaminyldiphosphoundecaprenol N-acetyl-beta-D-mannosaminyltransferase